MKRASLCLIVLATALALATEARCDYTYSYTTIDYPGAVGTWAEGINDAGQVAGYYQDATGVHGFLYDGLGAYSTLDYPGASRTYPSGINNSGDIAVFADKWSDSQPGGLSAPPRSARSGTALLGTLAENWLANVE